MKTLRYALKTLEGRREDGRDVWAPGYGGSRIVEWLHALKDGLAEALFLARQDAEARHE